MFSENSSCFRSYFGRYLYLLADYVKLDNSVILTSNWDLFPPTRGALKAKINFFILFSPFLFWSSCDFCSLFHLSVLLQQCGSLRARRQGEENSIKFFCLLNSYFFRCFWLLFSCLWRTWPVAKSTARRRQHFPPSRSWRSGSSFYNFNLKVSKEYLAIGGFLVFSRDFCLHEAIFVVFFYLKSQIVEHFSGWCWTVLCTQQNQL